MTVQTLVMHFRLVNGTEVTSRQINYLVALEGVEPSHPASKAGVLPLDDRAMVTPTGIEPVSPASHAGTLPLS